MIIPRSKWTPLFLSNFLGVYNDNLLKNCIIFLTVGWVLPAWLTQSQLISLVSASLVIPYLFLSPLGGRLAVVYSKQKVFRFFKLIELPIMLIACVAFYFQWIVPAVLSVLLMGIQSCLYSPSKYSLIRDIGGEEGVSFGSGVFETMAFLGILIGTVTAAILSDINNELLIYSFFIGLAIIGYITTRSIRAQELPEKKDELVHLNPVRFLVEGFRFAKQHSFINIAVFGASAFWLIGGMLQMNLIIHCKQIYQATNTTTGLVMAFAAIGIALGSLTAGKLSGNTVKKGFILIGIAGMSTFLFLITFVPVSLIVFVVFVFFTAFMGGFFQIPCLSIIQQAPIERKLGDMIAYLNLVTFIFVLIGTALFSLTTYVTDENSIVVFGVILAVCLLVMAIFLFYSSEFWKQTKFIFNNLQPK
jgi:acyl-[acyl-carrier-protein]-phospholipid O-acyltransferase/long-chain-fatty-acid--[acyl-carrier-protein] ligase